MGTISYNIKKTCTKLGVQERQKNIKGEGREKEKGCMVADNFCYRAMCVCVCVCACVTVLSYSFCLYVQLLDLFIQWPLFHINITQAVHVYKKINMLICMTYTHTHMRAPTPIHTHICIMPHSILWIEVLLNYCHKTMIAEETKTLCELKFVHQRQSLNKNKRGWPYLW